MRNSSGLLLGTHLWLVYAFLYVPILLLIVSGFTDWLDGFLARRWNQISRVGQLLDPIADRLYILATLVGLLLRGIVPWWFVVILLSRDVLMAGVLWVLKRRDVVGLPVHFLGKAATFALLYGFPFVLLGAGDPPWQVAARVLGWACVIWGAGLYWWSGLLYLGQGADVIRRIPVGSTDRVLPN